MRAKFTWKLPIHLRKGAETLVLGQKAIYRSEANNIVVSVDADLTKTHSGFIDFDTSTVNLLSAMGSLSPAVSCVLYIGISSRESEGYFSLSVEALTVLVSSNTILSFEIFEE